MGLLAPDPLHSQGFACAVRSLANRASETPLPEGCRGNHFPCPPAGGFGQRPRRADGSWVATPQGLGRWCAPVPPAPRTRLDRARPLARPPSPRRGPSPPRLFGSHARYVATGWPSSRLRQAAVLCGSGGPPRHRPRRLKSPVLIVIGATRESFPSPPPPPPRGRGGRGWAAVLLASEAVHPRRKGTGVLTPKPLLDGVCLAERKHGGCGTIGFEWTRGFPR